MFKFVTLLSIASLALADRTFTLSVQGDGIDGTIGASGDNIIIGPSSSFNLQEPAGVLTVDGKYIAANPDGWVLDDSNKSSTFGYQGDKLSISGTETEFWACPFGDNQLTISNGKVKPECKSVSLILNGAAAASSAASSAAPSSTASSAAPSSAAESSAAPTPTTLQPSAAPATSQAPVVQSANGAGRAGASLAGLGLAALLI